MELARKLAREMDEHRTTSVSRVYAPNEYAVWLSPRDRARYEGVEDELIDELCAYLLEHARREELTLASHPSSPSTPMSSLRSASSGSRRGWCASTVPRRPDDHAGREGRRQPAAGLACAGRCSQRGRARSDDDLQHFRPPARAARAGPRRATAACPAAGRRPAPGGRPGRRGDRPQPRLRHRARRCRGLPPSRAAAPRRAGLDDRGSRLDQRRAPQRRGAAAARGRCRSATASSSARPRSSSSCDEYACARLGCAQVRLPRRALPVPAVGRRAAPCATSGARCTPAGSASRAGRDRARELHRMRPACTPPLRSAALDLAQARPTSGRRARRGHDPGMIYDLDGDLVLGRGDHAEIAWRIPSPPRATRASTSRPASLVLEDLGSTNGTYLNEELLDTPAPAAPRRSCADRRQRVRLRGGR